MHSNYSYSPDAVKVQSLAFEVVGRIDESLIGLKTK